MLELFQECINAHDKGAKIYPTTESEGYFLVKRIGTPQFHKELQQIRLTKFGYFSTESDIDHLSLMGAWLGEFGVVGWEGITDPKTGKEIKFSRAVAGQIFTNQAYIGLTSNIINHANDINFFLKANIEADEEDIKKP